MTGSRVRPERNETTLYLLRHGESTANVGDVFAAQRLDADLAESGVRQASAWAERLKDFPISVVYASSLRRARRTAEIVCRSLGVEPIFTSALMEVDVGDLEGKSYTDPPNRREYEGVLSLWEQGDHQESFRGGEALCDAEARLRGLLAEIERHGSGHILLAGHCLLFMAFIWLFCGNHGPTLESGHMGRGHLSILRGRGERFHIEEFSVAPPA
jgi:probable phosphoglycerate mutase